MRSEVDLRGLAVDRSDPSQHNSRARSNVITRYVFPIALIVGFLSLVLWASRDLLFPPKLVTVVPVVSSMAETRPEGTPLFKAAGWIEPRPTPVRVAALAPGVVDRLLVVEDQAVKAGDPIAELVKDDAELAYEFALADVELRNAELDEAKANFAAAETRLEQPVHLEAALSEAQAALAKLDTQLTNLPFEVRRAEADHETLRRDYEGKASAKGVIAGNTIAIAAGKVNAALALVEGLRSRSDSLRREQAALAERRNSLGTQLELLVDETKGKDQALAKINAATARLSQARVAVAKAKLQLDRMTIIAPVDGRVFRLIAHPGARIGSGMTQMAGHDGSTVITMYQPKMLQIRVDTRFEDIPKVRLGQPVQIANPALSSPLTGKVLFISSEADIQKNTLQVKVAIPEPPEVFKPEMLVDVTFLSPKPIHTSAVPTQEMRLYVPQQLIQNQGDGSFVWIADQSAGVARKTPVKTGAFGSNGLVEITAGLTVSNRVIVSGTDVLRDGDRIHVTGEDPKLGRNLDVQQNSNSKRQARLSSGGNP